MNHHPDTDAPASRTDASTMVLDEKMEPSVEVEPDLTGRNLRKRKSPPSNSDNLDVTNQALKPLTDEERRNWKGWVELESDPALFNFILREYGVKDVKVEEVLALDDEMINLLAQPVYGLIFLFKYRDEDDNAETETGTPVKCPKDLWFANQTVDNACATIALLNIVMNVPDIDVGDTLWNFKMSTQDLKPAYRGLTLSTDKFIRNIHNSFARRMDILAVDLALHHEYEKWKRAKKPTKRQKGSKVKRKKQTEDEPGYHFVAYVPHDGIVWRLDGLQRQPTNLGPSGDDWIAIARQHIYGRISKYEDDGVQFNLLALCESPLRSLHKKMAAIIKSIIAIENALAPLVHDWIIFVGGDAPPAVGELRESFGLTARDIDIASLPESAKEDIKKANMNPNLLIELRQKFVLDGKAFQRSYLEEKALVKQENEQAERRKEDLTPVVYSAIKKIAEAGILKEINSEVQGNKTKQ